MIIQNHFTTKDNLSINMRLDQQPDDPGETGGIEKLKKKQQEKDQKKRDARKKKKKVKS